MDKVPEYPILSIPSIEWLMMTQPRGASYRYNVAIARDALEEKIDVKYLRGILNKVDDGSMRGDSISLWIYRLGGSKEVLNTMESVHGIENPARAQLAKIARNLISDNSWIKSTDEQDEDYAKYKSLMSRPEHDFDYFSQVLQAAIERGNRQVVNEFTLRLPEFEERRIRSSDDKCKVEWLREVIERDNGTYQVWLKREDEDVDKKAVAAKHVKPVYEINDVKEAEKQFEKEAAKYLDAVVAIEERRVSQSFPIRPSAVDDRAFWLTMRLGELRDTLMLKKIVSHQYAGLETRREAVRQLIVLGEKKFLRGYALAEYKPDVPLKGLLGYGERVENDVPSYVAAILGQE